MLTKLVDPRELDSVVLRIKELTLSNGKNRLVCFASLMEEVGELAAALKIHYKIVDYKVLDEPVIGEIADVFICGWMMYFMLDGDIKNIGTLYPSKEREQEELAELDKADGLTSLINLTHSCGKMIDVPAKEARQNALRITDIASCLFVKFANEDDPSFEDVISYKLDKWQHNRDNKKKEDKVEEKQSPVSSNPTLEIARTLLKNSKHTSRYEYKHLCHEVEWVESHGETLEGYILRYGDLGVLTSEGKPMFGDGGTLIFDADMQSLRSAIRVLAKRQRIVSDMLK